MYTSTYIHTCKHMHIYIYTYVCTYTHTNKQVVCASHHIQRLTCCLLRARKHALTSCLHRQQNYVRTLLHRCIHVYFSFEAIPRNVRNLQNSCHSAATLSCSFLPSGLHTPRYERARRRPHVYVSTFNQPFRQVI
jgi:hypothetical protein